MKKQTGRVPNAVIKRLPRYHRYLGDLLANGITRISSAALSDKMRVTASQIRQDLNNFGGFGQQGYGYNVEVLYNEIGQILGAKENYKAILIGVGNLGKAIASNINFRKRGVELLALFDTNEQKIGTTVNNISVLDYSDIKEYVLKNNPEIAILTLPKTAAKKVADELFSYGVKGFWNFSNMELSGKEGYNIENVHLGDSLMTLCYAIKDETQTEIF